MTIDKQVFIELIGELQTYYKREFTPFVQRTWYKHLSDRLSTEEFMEAVAQAVIRCQFMPTPEQLVELIKGNEEGQALVAWQQCLLAAARSDRTIIDSLSPQGKFALTAIGGVGGLGRAEEERHSWLRKEFLAAWKSWLPSLAKALPPADDNPGLIDPGVDPQAVEHMRSLVEKVSCSRQNLRSLLKKVSASIVEVDVPASNGNSSSISPSLQAAVEQAIFQGANRVELSFAISDALEVGGLADELRDLIRSNPPLLAAQAINNKFAHSRIV